MATLVAGCGSSSVAEPVATSAAPSPSATEAAGATASASASVPASPTPTPTLPLPHLNAALEDLLPDSVGGVDLQKMSFALSTYIGSSSGGDRTLLSPWVVKFGKTADEVDFAVATDLTERIGFFVQAIQITGAKPADLTGEFAKLAKQAGWPVTGRTIATRPVLEITDPAAEAAGELATAYILANEDVMFVIVTDDPSLLVEALIRLPGRTG